MRRRSREKWRRNRREMRRSVCAVGSGALDGAPGFRIEGNEIGNYKLLIQLINAFYLRFPFQISQTASHHRRSLRRSLSHTTRPRVSAARHCCQQQLLLSVDFAKQNFKINFLFSSIISTASFRFLPTGHTCIRAAPPAPPWRASQLWPNY